MKPTKQSNVGYHLPSIPPSYPTVSQLVSTPFTTEVTSSNEQAYGQPYPQTYMEPMQMYQAAYHTAYNQPLHQHVLNPAAQTFIHSTQPGPCFSPSVCVPPMVPSASEIIPKQNSIKELLEEPMPYCDSEYCGGFCRGLAEDVPKTSPQPTAKLPNAGGKKACAMWQPRKFDFFSLSLKVRKCIYRHALIPFQSKGTRRAFQLSVELKTLFRFGNLRGLLESNKAVRLECLQVLIEQVDLQLYHHEVNWLYSHLRPLDILGSGLGAWNFRRLYFVADINAVVGVRCGLDLETRVMTIDLGCLKDTVDTNITPATLNNMVLVAKQIGSFMQPLFKELVSNKEVTKWTMKDIKMAGDRFFAVARPAFYNVDVEEMKDKWAKLIEPANRVLYGLDEEWHPRIGSLTVHQ